MDNSEGKAPPSKKSRFIQPTENALETPLFSISEPIQSETFPGSMTSSQSNPLISPSSASADPDVQIPTFLLSSDDETTNKDLEDDLNFDLYGTIELSSNDEEDDNGDTLDIPSTELIEKEGSSRLREVHSSLKNNSLPQAAPIKDDNKTEIPFIGSAGLYEHCPKNPIDFFRLLWTKELAEHIVKESNIYAENLEKISSKNKVHQLKYWTPLTVNILEHFLAVVFIMGQIKLPTIALYWRKSRIYNFSIITSIMPKNQFENILKALNFARNCSDAEPISFEPLCKVQPLIDFFHGNMKKFYYPKRELHSNGSLILWYGSLYFRPYLREGVKIYLLAQSNGLVLKIYVDPRSRELEQDEKENAEKVLKTLLEGFTGVENFIITQNTILLAIDNSTNKKAKEKSPEENREKGEIFQLLTGDGQCIMKLDSKYDTLTISSVQKEPKKTVILKRKGTKKTSNNQSTSGKDSLSYFLTYYPLERKHLRLSSKFGIHIFHTMLTNSYLLFKQVHGGKMSALEFNENVIEGLLVSSTIVLDTPQTSSSSCRIHLPTKSNRKARKRCQICWSTRKLRKDTQYLCGDCKDQPGLCLGPCFREYHNY